jgi:hypothetical protein
MSLRDRVRNGAAYSIDTGGMSGGQAPGPSPIAQSPGGRGPSIYDGYGVAAVRPQREPVTLRQRIAQRSEQKEYEGG